MNIIVLLGATLIPLIVGFIWYSPTLGFGKAWMAATGLTQEDEKKANMGLMFGLTILLSFFVAFIMTLLVIHQIHIVSLLSNQPDSQDPNSESMAILHRIMELYGTSYRTFKHGAFHGTIAGIMLAVPIIAIPALFERKSFKYVAINGGYWVVCMALMGGVICQFTNVTG
jgi:uncharacterized membrane protein